MTLKTRRSLENRTFERQLGLGPSKNGLREGVRKKHENSMKKRCENERFLMAQNHVWRYTLRFFHTFPIFEKVRKIDAKREAKSCHFWSKMRPWTLKGRFIRHFLTISENTKNRWFFGVALDVEKSIKNRALGRQRPKTSLRVIAGWDTLVTGAPRAAAIIKDIRRI